MYYSNLKRTFLLSTLILGIFRRTLATTKTMNTTNYIAETHSVAYVTVPNEEVAKNIARGLVTSKLAACVNVIPKVLSIYEWKGEVNEDSELLLMIKTRTSKVDELTQYVKRNHPYEVCEVISLPIASGNEAYLSWIGDVVPEK